MKKYTINKENIEYIMKYKKNIKKWQKYEKIYT